MSKISNNEVEALASAIALIESHGGFAMLPEAIDAKLEQLRARLELKISQEELKAKQQHINVIRDAFKLLNAELDEQIKTGRFDVNAFEDILHDEGLESDYLEDWINSYF